MDGDKEQYEELDDNFLSSMPLPSDSPEGSSSCTAPSGECCANNNGSNSSGCAVKVEIKQEIKTEPG